MSIITNEPQCDEEADQEADELSFPTEPLITLEPDYDAEANKRNEQENVIPHYDDGANDLS
jgi:hypothetical protein